MLNGKEFPYSKALENTALMYVRMHPGSRMESCKITEEHDWIACKFIHLLNPDEAPPSNRIPMKKPVVVDDGEEEESAEEKKQKK